MTQNLGNMTELTYFFRSCEKNSVKDEK